MYTVPHYIDGKTEEITHTTPHILHNPGSGEAIGQVYFADKKICDKAVTNAHAAFQDWAQTPPMKRGRILFEFRNLIIQETDALAKIICREQGKAIEDAKGSIGRAIELIEFHCNILSQLQGTFSSQVARDIDCVTQRQPLGVCVGIAPFNFPIMVPMWMIIPAIATGNTCIIKPSEYVPSTTVRILELLTKARLPDGVVNCLQGNQETVSHLITHPLVQAVTGVGSTPAMQSIYTTAIQHGKRAHTFGGAKNHAVVMPDAAMEETASAVVGAAFGSAGERCMALSVVVCVGKGTETDLLKHMIPKIKAIRVNIGTEKDCDMGPLIHEAHRNKVIHCIEKGVQEGAELMIDGRSFVHKKYPQGYFLGPSLFRQVKTTMSIYQQEIFGPVLVVLSVPDFEEALSIVNSNPYGNGTAIFTQNGYIARTYRERVQVGMVGINIPIPVPVASHPFGGWKASSFGDIPMHGEAGIPFYTKLKTTTIKWSQNQNIHSFDMPTHG
jgi:malonate-semialdehyde dehydrogenase (acetylating)/methylmalonate-semialdehyde dehydrogenase